MMTENEKKLFEQQQQIIVQLQETLSQQTQLIQQLQQQIEQLLRARFGKKSERKNATEVKSPLKKKTSYQKENVTVIRRQIPSSLVRINVMSDTHFSFGIVAEKS